MVNIPIEGKPTPKASWFGGEQKLKDDQRTTINTTATETSLLIRNAVQEDSGTYELILDNEVAKKSFRFFVVVFCPPGNLDGELKVSEINATSCLLNWNPPKDNGNSDLTGYWVGMREFGRKTWTPVSTSTTRTTLKVHKLARFTEYEFRVFAENKYGQGAATNSQVIRADYESQPPGPPSEPWVNEVTRSSAKIEWNMPINDGGAEIEGYWVEVKEINCVVWQRQSKMINKTSTTIKPLQEGLEYQFRIVGQNKSGLGKPSMIS